MSSSDRAHANLQHFILALHVFCGKHKITDEQHKYVLGRITDFFEKNPGWTIPSLKIYRLIFEKIGTQEKTDKFIDGGLRLLELAEENEYRCNNFKVVI